jgi:hypothetical protein
VEDVAAGEAFWIVRGRFCVFVFGHLVPPGALRVEGLNAKPRRVAGVGTENLPQTSRIEHGFLSTDLIVEDWGYLIPHFLGFFILFRWKGLERFGGGEGA